MRTHISVVIIVALLAGACSSESSQSSAGSDASTSVPQTVAAPVTDATKPPVTTSASDATEQALSGAGVTIVDSSEPVVTESILTLTTAQVGFMAEESAGHGGFIGSDLDAAGGGAPSGVPISAVLAGYVRGVQTEGAVFARGLMDGQDMTQPDKAVFPTIVLALFAADAANAFAADESTSDTTPPPGAAVAVGDGGIVEPDGGTIHFAIGGGCISIAASNSGVGLDQDDLVTLAKAAAGRIG